MKSICNQIKATVAVVAVTSMATLVNISSAEAAAFNLSWKGNQGYSAKGQFSYDDNSLETIVTKDQLTSFAISFLNPAGTVLKKFNYSFPTSSSSFNFNFNKATKTVLQTGDFDTPNGFDLGSNFAEDVQGFFFYTYSNPAQGLPIAKIFLKDDLSPEICDTFPNCRLDLGGQLIASPVPEPGIEAGAIIGLLVFGSLGRVMKKKPASP